MTLSLRQLSECYLARAPLPLLHAVHVLPLVGWLLQAHVAAVGHRGPSAHPLRGELHLRLAPVHSCWNKDTSTHTHVLRVNLPAG